MKSLLVVKESDVEAAKEFFAEEGFKIVTGYRYLGGFVGEPQKQTLFIQDRIKNWIAGVDDLARAAVKYPQTAYAGLQKSLQQEWQFLQRVTEGIEGAFSGLEEAISGRFLPALLGDKLPEDMRHMIMGLPVKEAGKAISDPSEVATKNWINSTVICGHIISAIRKTEEFNPASHAIVMQAGKVESRTRFLVSSEVKLSLFSHCKSAR